MTVPLPPPRLIGRQTLVTQSREHLTGNVVIVSETGMEGIGTTAIAQNIAHAAADAYPDGCIRINLRGSTTLTLEPLTPAQVQRRVLQSLQAGPEAEALPEDTPELNRMYQTVLSDHKVLLVLDDARNAAQLRQLLPRQGSSAIVTTQHDIATSYPNLFAITVPGLQPQDACSLIQQSAPTASNLSVARLVPLAARLRGVPLALRLVAPLLGRKAPLLSPQRLLNNLDLAQKRIAALRGPGFSNSAVYSAMEVAYEHLDPALKPYFEGLGVFSAPFTARAAASVWNVSPERAHQILTQLVELALLDHRAPLPYYELHHLVQLHAQELLVSQPERARELVSRYVEHFMREVIQVSIESSRAMLAHDPPRLDPYTVWKHLPEAWARANGALPAGRSRGICTAGSAIFLCTARRY